MTSYGAPIVSFLREGTWCWTPQLNEVAFFPQFAKKPKYKFFLSEKHNNKNDAVRLTCKKEALIRSGKIEEAKLTVDGTCQDPLYPTHITFDVEPDTNGP